MIPKTVSGSREETSTDDVSGLVRIGVQPTLRRYLAEIWGRREFIRTVAIGDLKAQNQNTFLGNLWHLLNPMFLAAVYYLIFGIIFNARGRVPNYPAFLVTGLLVFTYTRKSMMSGARTIVSNLSLMQAISFPRAALPISSVITDTMGQLFTLGALLVFVVVTGEYPTLTWLLVLPAFVVQAVWNLGLGFITARLTYHFRDMEQLLPYLIRIWMYLSGLFFTADFVDDRGSELISTVFRLNPMYALMTIFRDSLLSGTFNPKDWVTAIAWAVGALLLGFVFFWWHETEYSRG